MSDTAPMTMNRVIHQAVRRDLDRVERALREVRAGDRERVAAVRRAWDNLATQLTHHHEGEDQHVWPALQQLGVEPELLRTMETEHHQMADALAAATASVHRAAGTADAGDTSAAADAVARAHEVTARHLDHEEREVEPLIRAHRETPEWKAAEKRLRAGSPVAVGRFFAWVQDGMTPEARATFEGAIPAPVRFVFGRVLGRGYTREVAPTWR